MALTDGTIKLTVAQAIIRWLTKQYILIAGQEMRVCGGGFGIFGHGNVTCLGEALYDMQEALPLYRGRNEQSMGFAAAGYARQWLRQRFMFCTASAGPGTANLLTAAGLAHTNRLPMLLLCGDTFITRLPDPVLQQLENFSDPIYSSVLSQKKLIVLLLDNGGFAVINKLQNNTGNESFNSLIADCQTIPVPFGVDFVAHAASMGGHAEKVANPAELADAFLRAKVSDKTCVIVMDVDPYQGWTTQGHSWWEVGTPHITGNERVRKAHENWESSRPKQRKGV